MMLIACKDCGKEIEGLLEYENHARTHDAPIERRICKECKRIFNLLDKDDANEWYYGHDCE